MDMKMGEHRNACPGETRHNYTTLVSCEEGSREFQSRRLTSRDGRRSLLNKGHVNQRRPTGLPPIAWRGRRRMLWRRLSEPAICLGDLILPHEAGRVRAAKGVTHSLCEGRPLRRRHRRCTELCSGIAYPNRSSEEAPASCPGGTTPVLHYCMHKVATIEATTTRTQLRCSGFGSLSGLRGLAQLLALQASST
jgi:hypothetical protein